MPKNQTKNSQEKSIADKVVKLADRLASSWEE